MITAYPRKDTTYGVSGVRSNRCKVGVWLYIHPQSMNLQKLPSGRWYNGGSRNTIDRLAYTWRLERSSSFLIWAIQNLANHSILLVRESNRWISSHYLCSRLGFEYEERAWLVHVIYNYLPNPIAIQMGLTKLGDPATDLNVEVDQLQNSRSLFESHRNAGTRNPSMYPGIQSQIGISIYVYWINTTTKVGLGHESWNY